MSGRIVVAGLASGSGKTTLACALIAAWSRRGRRIQPFKIGPDYIDPGYHSAAAGRPSRNLDGFLLPPATLLEVFARAAAPADAAVIEGVMGLFDGRAGSRDDSSTAAVAKLLGAPVIVILDVRAMAQTAAALALGAARLDPTLDVRGFVLGQVASASHARSAAAAVEAATGLPVLGTLPTDERLALPERHLGLVTAAERPLEPAQLGALAEAAERHLDLERIWDLTAAAPPLAMPLEAPPARATPRLRIAVARDEAFSFYYEDSLELLEREGAELVPFSPLRDESLPPGTRGIYIGGGFPELHARALAENTAIRAAIRDAAARGTVVYGECGGLMYLGGTLADMDGERHEMVGLLPLRTRMRRTRAALGYRTVTALRASPLLEAGETVRGHEFHWSELEQPLPTATAAYSVAELGGAAEGYAAGRLLASYVHIHLASRPAMARRLVRWCANGAAA